MGMVTRRNYTGFDDPISDIERTRTQYKLSDWTERDEWTFGRY
jgi:hypothetical protein